MGDPADKTFVAHQYLGIEYKKLTLGGFLDFWLSFLCYQ